MRLGGVWPTVIPYPRAVNFILVSLGIGWVGEQKKGERVVCEKKGDLLFLSFTGKKREMTRNPCRLVLRAIGSEVPES